MYTLNSLISINGSYTTKDYDKHYISYCIDPSRIPIYGENTAILVTAWFLEVKKNIQHGVIRSEAPNRLVVFTYKRVQKRISESDYNSLDLAVDTRICNGIISVKVEYDNDRHTITEYRHTNSGRKQYGEKPYKRARILMPSCGII